MTEEEAKTKWCPMKRIGGYADSAGQNFSVNPEAKIQPDWVAATKCIGSACMMWRVEKVVHDSEGKPESMGYCGLAGKP